MRLQILTIRLILISLLLYSCQSSPPPANTTSHLRMMDDTLLDMNKKVVQDESQSIEDFIARYHWNMEVTSTGLRYMIYQHGTGTKAFKGSHVKISYSIRLLTGRDLNNPGKQLLKEFQLGRGMAENGLEEGILNLRVGDHAKFIVPSHLAFGLLGDLKNIPERASLVYDLELLEVKKNSAIP
jgi:FKBP-type peptidyl-prolyl cis-trans isomerase FkpA